MPEIHLRLYEELNEFLPINLRKRRFAYMLDGIVTVEGMLAKIKVPRDEVELILVNGESVGFSHLLRANDLVALYPVFESFDVTPLLRTRKKPLRKIRFLAEPGLLRLTRYLRRLGFEVLDAGSWTHEEIVRVAEKDHRILLTRNIALLESGELSRICFVRAAKPKDQLRDVLSRLDLFNFKLIPELKSMFSSTPK
jgi:hypothetical protein